MEFYYTDQSGQPVGPISQEQIQALLHRGIIHEHTMVAPVGASEWQPLGTLFEIEGPPVAPQPRPQAISNPRPRAPMYSGVSNPQGTATPPATAGVFASISPWAYVTSIYWWINTLLVLAGAGFLIYGALKIPPEMGQIRNYLLLGGLILLVPTGLCLLPAMQCWSLGTLLSALRSNPAYLETASLKQASYFKTFSIYLILMVLLIGAGLILAIVEAANRSASPSVSQAAVGQISSLLVS